jgi:ABC-type lipopolysaccharide export system ATPase subunit
LLELDRFRLEIRRQLVHGSRFQILDPPPAGRDPAHQIRQPLAQIRRQLVAFFVLGPR